MLNNRGIRAIRIDGPRITLIVAVLLIASVWLSALINLELLRAADAERVRSNVARLNTSLSYSVARVSSELDTLLLFLRSMRNARDRSVTWQDIVTEQYTVNRQTAQIAVIAKDGMMVTSSKMLYPKKPVDLSDRAHYLVHVNSGHDQLYISEPVLGRASQTWSIQYTRPLLDRDGVFSGVIVVSLSLDKIVKLFDGANIGKDDGIAVVGHDGLIRAGAGRYEQLIGEFIPKALLHAAEGPAYNRFSNDIVSAHKVDNFPLTVIVSKADLGIIGWYWDNNLYLFALLLVSAIVLCGAGVLSRQMRRHASLLEESRRLELEKEIAMRTSRLKSEFLSVMSHEIRTPLNGILGSLELISTEKLAKKTVKQIGIARSSGVYLLGLIDDILVFLKSNGGKVALDEQFHGLRSFIGEITWSLSRAVQAAGNELVVEVGDDVPDTLRFDVVKLRQVITNLLGNANKFTQDGCLTLSVSLIDCVDGRAKLRFSVSDTGIGIPKDQHAAIFERFTSLDSSLSRRSDGTGLGLTISKQIINSMGSDIVLHSEIGQGSCFAFDLKLVVAAPDDNVAEDSDLVEREQSTCCKILLAEDNDANAYIASEFLSSHGHTVIHARDGDEAIAAAQAEAFDLIFMDLSMPKRDGLSAARAIRAGNNPNVETAIVALTAHVSDDTAQSVTDAGMNGYLTKPISSERLVEAVRRYRNLKRTITHDLVRRNQSSADVATDGLKVFDSNQFNQFFKNYDAEKRSRLLSIFLTQLESNKAELNDAIDALNESSVRSIAHAILGSSSTIGAERLAALCREVQYADGIGPSFNWDNCKLLVDLVNQTAGEVEKKRNDVCIEGKIPELV